MNLINPQEGNSEWDEDSENTNTCNKPYCWWSPQQNWVSVAFCNETSIHGLKFWGQEKRHLTERIFWFIGFWLSFTAAILLIKQVYENYSETPVIVSYQSQEQGMETLPFPAVTLCNMNKFPKSKVNELLEIVKNPNNTKYQDAKQKLAYVDNACNAQQSFAKVFRYAHLRGKQSNTSKNHDQNEPQDMAAMNDFIIDNTLACHQLVRLCLLGEEPIECGQLFKPVITDFGKCCTFNILPLPLLLKNPATENQADPYDNPALGKEAKRLWPMEELTKWKQWDYDRGFVLADDTPKPWRQRRAGLPYGLSVLVDPNTEDYFCPASDSVGVRYILHNPLEMPQVMAFSSVAAINKEVLIEVHPDMTNADEDIRGVDPKDRECYFGKEKSLKFYWPYTGGNCAEDCSVEFFRLNCSCTPFHMPRESGVRICNSDPDSSDAKCVDKARQNLQDNFEDICGDCNGLCESLEYNYETTIADIQPAETLWGDPDPKIHKTVPEWANHNMSIIHIFFGSESTVPKYRQKMYGITDLIANTGGILGLCLGFSILSGAEVIYFITLRACWRYCRKRKESESHNKMDPPHNQVFRKVSPRRVINLNPEKIPVFGRNIHHPVAPQYWNTPNNQYYGATTYFKSD